MVIKRQSLKLLSPKLRRPIENNGNKQLSITNSNNIVNQSQKRQQIVLNRDLQHHGFGLQDSLSVAKNHEISPPITPSNQPRSEMGGFFSPQLNAQYIQNLQMSSSNLTISSRNKQAKGSKTLQIINSQNSSQPKIEPQSSQLLFEGQAQSDTATSIFKNQKILPNSLRSQRNVETHRPIRNSASN